MRECDGGPCRDWVLTLAHDGMLTGWGWATIVVIILAELGVCLAVILVIDKLFHS